MPKSMFDPDALVQLFETASAKQGAELRKAMSQATLTALQGRELSLKNIRATLKSMSELASQGAAKNMSLGIDPAPLLDQAVAGMDDALVKAVEAHRLALRQLVGQGADLREQQLKKALAEMDKFEDTMFAAFKKTAEGAGAPMAGPWDQVLKKMQAAGTLTGASATGAQEQLADLAAQMQATLRSTRAAQLRAAQTLADSYTAMVSGVLIGMSEALQAGTAPKKPPRK